MGFKLGGAGVDTLIRDAAGSRPLAQGHAPSSNRVLFDTQELRQAFVGEAEFFGLDQEFRRQTCGSERCSFADESRFELDNFTNLLQKPGIDLGEGEQFLIGHAETHAVGQPPEPIRQRRAHGFADLFHRIFSVEAGRYCEIEAHLRAEPELIDLHGADRFLQRFLEGSSDRHGLADRFHLRRQCGIGPGEFLKGKPGNFDDDVIDGRLERGLGDSGNVVGNFVEGIPDGQLGRDLGDWKSRRL